MAKIMKSIFGIALLMTVGCCVIYRVKSDNIFFILVVTFGTTAYHFGMRLLVGTVFDCIMKNRADYTKRWYHVNDLEMKLSKLKTQWEMEKNNIFDEASIKEEIENCW